MEETKIDRETMGRLAKALAFIGSPDDPVVIALRLAAETGTDRDKACREYERPLRLFDGQRTWRAW